MTQFQRQSRRNGFTLVEMLVVLGIIAVLAALLLPAAMGAVTRARDAAIGFEVNQLASAIESYKQDKGDYPPNFRSVDVFIQHVRRCYPKIAPSELNWFIDPSTGGFRITPGTPPVSRALDEGEALVFWLSHTTTDPRYPFGLTQPASAAAPTFKRYYEFDESRLESLNTDPKPSISGEPRTVEFKSYHAKHCKDSFYLYVDSRSYTSPLFLAARMTITPYSDPTPPGNQYAYAEDDSDGVRPYWSSENLSAAYKNVLATAGVPNPDWPTRTKYAPINPTTFQLICAGQDGLYGLDSTDEDLKQFPSGSYYSNADKDNITNFSGGRRLEASAGKTK